MIIELTPETFFEHINREGPLHVVMHYGATCGPCKNTMPHYELLESHFVKNNFSNIKFYRFHQWEAAYRQFIDENGLGTNGVPTFRYYYMGEKLHEVVSGYNDPNVMKNVVAEVVKGIEETMGGFPLYDES
jgi:thiol-disulfide isomerase/thioredoxin